MLLFRQADRENYIPLEEAGIKTHTEKCSVSQKGNGLCLPISIKYFWYFDHNSSNWIPTDLVPFLRNV
jgi:hypothetical protein